VRDVNHQIVVRTRQAGRANTGRREPARTVTNDRRHGYTPVGHAVDDAMVSVAHLLLD
jgi:hypothetical protein